MKILPSPHRRHPRGFFVQDAIIGLFIVLALTASFAYTLSQHSKASAKLADQRTATRMAENALLTLQTQSLPAAQLNALTCTRLPPAPDTPSAHAWVQVTAQHNQAHVSLVGLVPVSSLPQEFRP